MEMEQRQQNVYDGNPLVNNNNADPGMLCEFICVYSLFTKGIILDRKGTDWPAKLLFYR